MDILEFFKNEDIKYWTLGKNVSNGWVNIRCPFCDDTSNHLGIYLKNYSKCTCWKCGQKTLLEIITELKGGDASKAKEVVKELKKFDGIYYDDKGFQEDFGRVQRLAKKVILPIEATDKFPRLHLKYLRERNFHPKKIIEKYKLKACYMDGQYKYRIIIPIYQDRTLVGFTSRDVTGKQKLRYKTAPFSKSLIDPKEMIYNFDSVNEYCDAALCEGPTDVWRFGDGAFCFMGIKLTQKRIVAIGKKKIRNLYVCYDNDMAGRVAAKTAARNLAPLVKEVHIVRFKSPDKRYNDVADLSDKMIIELKEMIRFKAK